MRTIVLRPERTYLDARYRRTVGIIVAVVAAISAIHLVDDINKGMPMANALGLFALTTVIPAVIIIAGMKYFVSRWSMILKSDGSIEITGPRSKTIRSYGADPIVIERSPDGQWWLVIDQGTRKTRERVPFGAFPRLQEAWNGMRQ